MARFFGARGSWRKRRFLVATITSSLLLLLFVTPHAQAVHDLNLFELDFVTTPTPQGDANVTDNNKPSPYGGDDWDEVFAGTSSADQEVFIQDGTSPAQQGLPLDKSYFTGGSTKDPLDIGSNGAPSNCGTGNKGWGHTASDQAPDKDEIIDAFAAAYTNPVNSHTIFYFGLDRFDNSGDSQLGFWFYKSGVSEINPGGTGGFLGCHTAGNPNAGTVGDILVLTDFVTGGKIGEVRVFEWVGGNNPLLLVADSLAADCSTVGSGDKTCGVINNRAGENPPWGYENKNGQNSYLRGELFEGGVDLNEALGTSNIGCFSNFLAETRSSASTTAQLKDYALGKFGGCGVTVTTSPSHASVVLGGDTVHDTATVTGTGGLGTPPVPTGTVAFFVCQPNDLDGNGECSTGGTQVGTPLEGEDLSPTGNPSEAQAVSEEYTPTVVGTHCWRAEYSGDGNYDATSDFDKDTECFNVTDTSSITTAQNWLPNDDATITSAGGTPLNGSLVFTLYDNGTCNGNVLYTEPTINLVNAASGVTKSTTNTAVKVSATKTVSWKVVFTSTDGNVAGSTSGCETTSLTITN